MQHFKVPHGSCHAEGTCIHTYEALTSSYHIYTDFNGRRIISAGPVYKRILDISGIF